MDIKQLIHDDDAVSPVVGGTLLVAITIILAAGTASLLLGIGESQPAPAPQVSFGIDYAASGNGNLTVTHRGGDTPEPSNIGVVADEPFHPAPGNDTGSPSGPSYRELDLDSGIDDGSGGTEQWVEGEMVAGTSFTIVGTSASGNLGAATVRVVHRSDTGDRTTTLLTWEGPGA